jgi:hypothetical protein
MDRALRIQLSPGFSKDLEQKFEGGRSPKSPISELSTHERLLREAVDLEAQQRMVAAEGRASSQLKLAALSSWFILNLILTISNKAVLGKVRCTIYYIGQS